MTTPSLGQLARASFKIGCLGFGGPAGQIALMHRVYVDENKWIDEPRYLHALNYCMLLPGPEAQQLATYVGWLLHGVRGGLISGLLFILPGACVILALSWLYAAHGDTPALTAAFVGIKAAVLAFIADALLRIGKRALKGPLDLTLAVAAFAALYFAGLPFPLVILAAGVIGAFALRATPVDASPAPSSAPHAGKTLITAAVCGAAWLAPVALVLGLFGPRHLLSEVALLFSQLAVVTFGGAYAMLAYLQQQAVDVHAWLTPAQMIDGLGLAETTPGPLILVNQYVGFIAGWNEAGFGLALAAAALAGWCTFAPSFLWIFAGAPYAEQLRHNHFAAGALRAITAAVLGVIASLALWFGLAVLFPGRALASFDWLAAGIALAAAIALIRFKANAALVVLACAAASYAFLSLPLQGGGT